MTTTDIITDTETVSPSRVAVPHPTAKAFFDALDTKQSSSKQSTSLQRRSQSLGWRNRFSQNDHYPISITTPNHENVSFTVQQMQRGEVDGTYGTGATVWPAAMVLLKYLERNSTLLHGKRVVDLGSGTGVTSLAAAILGASHVFCTDGEDSVVQLAFENCQRVGTQSLPTQSILQDESIKTDNPIIWLGDCPIVVQKYWWGTSPLPDVSCDIVLVADCVLPKLYPIAPLVQAIDELLSTDTKDISKDSKGRLAILSYEHRYYPDYDPRIKFKELAQQRGLIVDVIPQDQLDPVYCVDDIEIWHVTKIPSL